MAEYWSKVSCFLFDMVIHCVIEQIEEKQNCVGKELASSLL